MLPTGYLLMVVGPLGIEFYIGVPEGFPREQVAARRVDGSRRQRPGPGVARGSPFLDGVHRAVRAVPVRERRPGVRSRGRRGAFACADPDARVGFAYLASVGSFASLFLALLVLSAASGAYDVGVNAAAMD